MFDFATYMLGQIALHAWLWGPAPTDTRATHETRALYATLHQNASQTLLLGHQNAYIQGANWHLQSPPIKSPDWTQLTQQAPAIAGFDFGNFKDTDGLPFHRFLPQVKAAARDGAIVTFSWHMYNPLTGQKPGPGDTDTRDAVKAILPGQPRHAWYRKQLDRIAVFFRASKDDQGRPIPIIFRPFHEHNGDWFWWSRTSLSNYIKLWRWTVHYLRDTKQIHQLLYAFSPSSQYHKTGALGYLRGYPGHAYVDIFGLDCYARHVKSCLPRLREMVVLARLSGKIAAFTESGQPKSRELTRLKKPWTSRFLTPIKRDPIARHLSYAMFWRNASHNHRYIPIPAYGLVPASTSAADFQRMCKDPFVAHAGDFRRMQQRAYPDRRSLVAQLASKLTFTPQVSPTAGLTQRQRPSALLRSQKGRLLWLRFHADNLERKALPAKWRTAHNPAIWEESLTQRPVIVYRPATKQQGLYIARKNAKGWQRERIPHQLWAKQGKKAKARIAGQIQAFPWVSAGRQNILFPDQNGRLHWLSRQGWQNPWRAQQLHTKLPKLPPIQGRSAFWTQTADLTMHIVSRGRVGGLLHMRYEWPARKWRWQHISKRFPQHTHPASAPSVYTWRLDRRQHVLYRGKNGHVYELIRPPFARHHKQFRPMQAWQLFDLHAASGARVKAVGTPHGHSARYENAQYVFFRNQRKELHAFVYRASNRRWQHLPLHQLGQLSTLRATADPVSFDWRTGRSLHLLFPGNDGHLHELWRERGKWRHTNLSHGARWPRLLNTPRVFQAFIPSLL